MWFFFPFHFKAVFKVKVLYTWTSCCYQMVLTDSQRLPTFHENLIITLIITLPNLNVILGVLSLVPSLQEHGSEWVIQWDFFPKFLWVTIIVGILNGWSHQPYHPRKTSTSTMCQQLENQCSRVISQGLWGFTHTLTMCICVEKPLLWHGGLLTQSGFFFFKLSILTASLYWCSEGFPCRFHCVCTQLLCNMDSF